MKIWIQILVLFCQRPLIFLHPLRELSDVMLKIRFRVVVVQGVTSLKHLNLD